MVLAWRKWLKQFSLNCISSARTRTTRRRPAPRAQIALEVLECRVTPTVFTVTTLQDSGSGSLRQAIASSNSAGGSNQIVFSGLAASGVIMLTSGALPSITDNLEIAGPGSSVLTVSGNESSGIFVVGSAGTATITGLSIVQASAGGGSGGGVNNAGNLTLDSCIFSLDSASAGGAIENSGTLLVTGCTFTSNHATSTGGAIDNSAGTFTIANSTFTSNSAGTGGGVAADSGSGSPLSISASTFSSNSATNGGGVGNSASLTIIGSTLNNNTATKDGAGVYNMSTLEMSLSTAADNSLVISSSSGGGGAGIYTDNGGTLSVSDSDVVSNAITYTGSGKNGVGAGIDVNSGTANLLNTIVIANTLAGAASDVSGTLNSGESHYDMIGTGGGGGLSNGSNGNQIGVSVASDGLINLGSFGGPTQTIAIMPGTVYQSGSPAQSAGTNVLAKTSSSISSSQSTSTFTVTDATYLGVGMTVLIGSEEMTITSVSGTSITVSRSGSGPSHGSGASIGLPTDQRGMVRTDGGPTDIGSYEFTGFSPSLIQSAYGISSLPNFSNAVGENGAGQTIALIDMYTDPNIESDLTTFDEEFGLPAPPSFLATSETGGTPTGGESGGWDGEESLDVEWAHALAPMANILVVECADNLNEGADWAATATNVKDSQTGTYGGGASVVSMSFTSYGGYDEEPSSDSQFSAANYPGVTFLSGTGDNGEANNAATVSIAAPGSGYSPGELLQVNNGSSPNGALALLQVTAVNGSGGVKSVVIASGGFYTADPANPASVTPSGGGNGATFNLTYGNQAGYPSDSPDVVAVGGTALAVNANGGYGSEGVWNDNNGSGATGGGISDFETAPTYQQGLTIHNGGSTISAGGMRATPDVTFVGDPYSGVPIYDSYGGSTTYPASNWQQIGGTSLATPCWAALVAIADQVRVANGGTPLTGQTQTLPILYSLYDNGANPNYSQYFNDVTVGNNSVGGPTAYTAGPGYDLVSGLGSPIENNLIPALANAISYVGATGTNTYVLQAVGSNIVLTDNGSQVASYPIASTSSVVIDGGTTNSLTVNYNNSGALLPTNLNISFTGGSSGAGSLTIQNSTFGNENYNFSSTTAGVITLGSGAVLYTGVTSITDSNTSTHTLTLHGGTFATETYNYTNGVSGSIAFGGTTLHYSAVSAIADADAVATLNLVLPANAVASLQDAGSTSDGLSGVSGNTLTATTFQDPTTLLAIVASGGGSQITLNGMDSAFAPSSGETLSGAAGDAFYLDSQADINSWATLDVSTATLIFNAMTAVTDSGVIANGAGAGNVAQEGAGAVTFTGANTYTGTTIIAAGSTLQVGSNGTTGSLGTGAITDNGALIWDKSSSTTLSTAISGSGSLTQEGSGTLTLMQTNSYGGGTMIAAGSTLQIGSGGAAGSITGSVSDLGTLIFDLTGVTTLAGVISGAGAVTQAGAGTLILAATNTYTGVTSLNSGTLEAGAVNAFGSLSSVAMVAGTVLDLNGYSQTLGSLSGAGTVQNASATASTLTTGGNNSTTSFSGNLQNGSGGGALSLLKNGTGTFTLSGTDTYTGATTVASGGVLQAGSTGAIGAASDVTVAGGGTLSLNGFSLTVGSLAGGGLVQDANAIAATLTAGGDNASTTFSGLLQDGTGGGSLSLSKTGSGTLTLSGVANSYSGVTKVSAGVLSIPNIGNSGANSSIGAGSLTLAGGTLSYTGSSTSSNLNLTLTAASTLAVTTATTALTMSGTETGAFTLTTSGAGTLAFTTPGALNATGGLTVAGGTLAANSQTLSSTLKLSITAGATFASTGTLQLTPSNVPITLVSGAGTLQLAGTGNSTASPDIVEGTAVGTSQPVTIALAVNLGASPRYIETFSNGNLFSVDGGDLILNGAITGTAASGLTFFGVANGSTLPVTVLSGANSGFLGAVNLQSGELVLNSSTALTAPNALTLDPAAGASSVVYLNGNSLAIGSLSSAGAVGAVAVNNGSSSPATLTVDSTASAAFAGPISNGPNDAGMATTGALALKYSPSNNATLTLTGASTYSGATTVNGGTLIVNGSLSTSSTVTVAPGATLGGSGVVGPVIVNGNLTPGGPAQLTTGALTFGPDSTLNVVIDGPSPGSGYDQVVDTSASGVSLGSPAILNLTVGYTPGPGAQYTLISGAGGSVSGVFNDLSGGSTFSVNGQVFTISYASGSVVLTAGVAPTITTSPANQTLIAGGVATFSAAGTGLPAPTIQWEVSTNNGVSFSPLSNNTTYSGVNTGTLTVSNVTAAMNGYRYQAYLSNIVATVPSGAAALTVDSAPSVTTEPPPATTIDVGQSTSFTVAATGNPAPTVQWQVSTDDGATFTNVTDGGVYSGSGTNTLSISNATASLNGDLYQAVFTNTLVGESSPSTDITSFAALTVDAAPSITSSPANQTLIAGGVATFSAAGTGLPAPTIQWEVSTNNGLSFSLLSNNTTYSGVNTGTLTVSNVTAAMNGYQYQAYLSNIVATVPSGAAALTVDSAPSVTTEPPPATTIDVGQSTSFTVAATGNPAPTVQWQVSTDGGATFTNVTDGGVYSGSATNTLTISNATASLNGDLYQAVFTNTLVGESSPSTDITSFAALTVDAAPTITTSPASQAVNAGGAVSFSAAATGYPTPTVQWQVSIAGGPFANVNNSSIYSGATTGTLTIANASQSMNSYVYQAVFSNTILGNPFPVTATSGAAVLTVDTPASIVSSPASQTINAGGATSFTVVDSGSPTPSIQWQVSNDGGKTFANVANGGFYGGAASTTLTITGATAALNGAEYQAVVSNLPANTSTPVTATSAAAALTVGFAPTVTAEPSSIAINSGGNATFSAAANGNPAPSVQWEVSTDGGKTFSNVSNGGIYSGADTDLLTITGATESLNGSIYQAVFSNTLYQASAPSTTPTSHAALTVDAAAVITSSPTASAINAGGATSFSAAASGNPAPSIQWQVSTDGGKTFANISNGGVYGGAASNTLTITGATAAMNGNLYQAVASNTLVGASSPSTDVSNSAQLTVEYGPTNPTQTGNTAVNVGGSTSLAAAAGGNPAPSVQWQVSTDGGKTFADVADGGVYSNATSNTLTITGATEDMNGYEYQAVFSNTLLNASSPTTAMTSPSILSVDVAPVVTQFPASSSIDAGMSTSFTAAASGNPAPSVQWQVSTDGGKTFTNVVDGGVYTGAASNTLTIANAPFTMNKDLFQAVFSNTLAGNSIPSTATSPSAQLTVAVPNDPATSVVSASSSSLASSGSITITLQAKDSLGNDVPIGGQTVTFGLANPASGGRGIFSPVVDNHDGTYTTTFMGTYAGANTITATIGGQTVTSSLPAIAVTPGALSLSQSQVTTLLSSVQLGGQTTITLQAEDSYGNKETTGGQSVSFQLANATGGQGIISPATDNKNGTYTATFIGTVVGANAIDATIAGLGQVASTPALSVTGAAFLLANSQVTVAAPGSVASGGPGITVSLQAEYAKGVNEKSGGLSVAFALGSASGGQGVFTTANYVGNGLYQATFTGSIAGSNTVTATINGLKVTSKAPTIKVTPGALSDSNSLVTLSTASVKAGGTATVTFQPRDAAGNKLVIKNLSVAFAMGASSGQGKFSPVPAKYNTNGTYTATFTGTLVGGNTIVTTVGGQAITSTPPVITVTPGTASGTKSKLNLQPGTVVVAGTSISLTLQAMDAFGNLETMGGLVVVFKLGSAKGGLGTFGKVTDNKNGTYTVTFTGTIAGTNTITATINGAKVTTAIPPITVTAGPVSLVKSVETLSASSVAPGGGVTVFLTVKDAGGNLLTDGTEDVSFALGNASGAQGTFGDVEYLGNGKYAATFVAETAGTNTIIAMIGGSPLTAKPLSIKVT
jgi:autotransporter-associated beta strand protein